MMLSYLSREDRRCLLDSATFVVSQSRRFFFSSLSLTFIIDGRSYENGFYARDSRGRRGPKIASVAQMRERNELPNKLFFTLHLFESNRVPCSSHSL